MDRTSVESSEQVYKMAEHSDNKRPHFSIDWRQLTYYHRERRSIFGAGGSLAQTNNNNKHRCTGSGNKSKKLILNSLDGCFKSGQLSAILGPSGAGKSTFLSVLFGNKQETALGQTKVTWFEDSQHQRPINSQIKQRPIRIAFLPQHDHLLNHLSVYETLLFASKIKNATRLQGLKLKSKDREHFHMQNVKRVAKMLKLSECLQTRCGRLSGGQYKRVSIGQELLSEPDVIILDEPTSGLDAMTCLTTIQTLKSIASRQPISIILTIHQPDIDVFNLFDHIYVIAQGGRAIYEGHPSEMIQALARANLHMPSSSYNPARFIVENAFISPPDSSEQYSNVKSCAIETTTVLSDDDDDDGEIFLETSDTFETSDQDEKNQTKMLDNETGSNIIKRSLLSLTDALNSNKNTAQLKQTIVNLNPISDTKNKGTRESVRKPLLNFGGVKTSDGRLITSCQLGLNDNENDGPDEYEMEKEKRLNLLKRLNELQRAKYYAQANSARSTSCTSDTSSEISNSDSSSSQQRPHSVNSSSQEGDNEIINNGTELDEVRRKCENQSDFIVNLVERIENEPGNSNNNNNNSNSNSNNIKTNAGRISTKTSGVGSTISYNNSTPYATSKTNSLRTSSGMSAFSGGSMKLKRHFDKRLSAKHNNSKQKDYPIYYHSYLLTQRTWLSIVRDPVFFGIQFCMHTTIPILLALIFGSKQEEGCPRLGQFDLVHFAYQPDSNDFIKGTMQSIRQSIGNIGVVFFEMFVLCFAINCITALVFPIDMYVLLKEYRNGWYALRSYFIGRTLADLPVPIVLHSMAMSILYYMTGQPSEWWRFLGVIVTVIIASLVAQSVGLTIGALLMQSSQSAVLAAAGIVAPFFALSGFIVRIHTLPWVAQLAAQGSYLYHLLNGFIVMRYGFGRCPCDESDFMEDDRHQIPKNLRTMASIWIGTYSNEYSEENRQNQLADSKNVTLTRTNVDPNIDLVDKLTSAFRMANSYGHKVDNCEDALPYAMLDFNLRDWDIWSSCAALLLMLLITRLITFGAIYYKIRSFS